MHVKPSKLQVLSFNPCYIVTCTVNVEEKKIVYLHKSPHKKLTRACLITELEIVHFIMWKVVSQM